MDNGAGSYRRFLDGDDDGFVEIIKDYKNGLMFYINGIVCNLHTAEDLTEETFVKIVTKKPHFSGKSSFKTWIYAIGRNVTLDYLRKNSEIKAYPSEEKIYLSADEEDFEKTFLKEERKIILHRAMCRLKPEYRQILWLIYFEDFSNKEAAKIMKKKVHNIEVLVSRARKALKEDLEREDFIYEEL
ncbi:MAG: RNA polymerase sigma factor [Acutalibacteraceae bacterium]|nr:RNA polymerase sigma factor [Acutalibacteraceae bacterium]